LIQTHARRISDRGRHRSPLQAISLSPSLSVSLSLSLSLPGCSSSISVSGIPWFYWEIIPNKDPHYSYDYEIGINDQNWDTFVSIANQTKNFYSPFNFSPYLLY
jgi:hypothetical protein